MPHEDLYPKLQHLENQVAEHAQGSTEIADMERLLLAELLGLGQALLQEFIEQKKSASTAGTSPDPSAGADVQ